MKPKEVRYRALLAVVYWDLTRDLNPLHVFYERTESCVLIASGVGRPTPGRGARDRGPAHRRGGGGGLRPCVGGAVQR